MQAWSFDIETTRFQGLQCQYQQDLLYRDILIAHPPKQVPTTHQPRTPAIIVIHKMHQPCKGLCPFCPPAQKGHRSKLETLRSGEHQNKIRSGQGIP
eukprot:1159761-Pelagomonas_calceolata.AAC.1